MRSIHIILFLYAFFLSEKGLSQEISNNRIKGIFMLRFTDSLKWPDEKKDTRFVYGIFGNPGLLREMRSHVNGREVAGHQVTIRNVESVFNIEGCHFLYVAPENSKLLLKILEKTTDKPIIVITDKESFGRKGADLNFVIRGNGLKYEICKRRIEAKDISVGPRILELGIDICK